MDYDDLEIIDDEIQIIKPSKLEWLKNNYKTIPMTYILVAINVVVFLLIHVSNVLISEHWFIMSFAKVSHYIAIKNQFYRLFTPIFMHESIMHLGFNCMAILYLGRPVEQIFGKYKLLIIFIVSGLFGSLSSFIFSSAISIGASGGVFGFFGVHIYLYLTNKNTYLKVFGKDIFQLLIINIIIGFTVPNIDFWAHFGGILGGFLACNSLSLSKKFVVNKNFIVYTTITVVLFTSLFFYFRGEYIKYNAYIDEAIETINTYAQKGDIASLKVIQNDFKEDKLVLPPFTQTDAIIDFLDDYINKYE